MYSIDLLKTEHKVITMLFAVVKKMCCNIVDGGDVNDPDMRSVVDFIKIYVEGYHHRKEESYLYTEMGKLGATAETMVHGIMKDHDRCHKYMLSLENSLDLYKKNKKTEYKLDILIHAMNYVQVLKLNNDKESNVVYSFANSGLSADVQGEIDKHCRAVEDDALIRTAKDGQLKILEGLCAKYAIAE